MIRLPDDKFYQAVSAMIKEKLKQAASTKELVDITGIYGIGTTYALTSFAKENGYPLIVGSNDTANKLRTTFSYPKIFNVYNLPDQQEAGGPVLIDAGIDRIYIEQHGLNVLTGYYRKGKH
ncbi:MAG: hypothetical protein ACM3MK_00065 [Chitinophagales bacterium]